MDVVGDDLLCLRTVVPWLSVTHITVYAHYREECACLHPTDETLDVFRARVLVARTEESAGIVCPPRETCSHEVEAGCYLVAEGLPVVSYVA